MNTVDSMWSGTPDRLKKARADARALRSRGEFISADSVMLSAYISVLGTVPWYQKLWYSARTYPHMYRLLKRYQELTYNQLDVLISFILSLFDNGFYIVNSERLIEMANREVVLAYNDIQSKPHQRAMATMNRAKARVYGLNTPGAQRDVDRVLNYLIELIQLEKDQPQGLRQLVRIYKKIGELYLMLGRFNFARMYLAYGKKLAEGEANTPDQVKKIDLVMKKVEFEEKHPRDYRGFI